MCSKRASWNFTRSKSNTNEHIISESNFSQPSSDSDTETGENNQESKGEDQNDDGDGDNVVNIWFRIRDTELDRDDSYKFLENIGPRNIPQGISIPVKYFDSVFQPGFPWNAQVPQERVR